MKIDLLADYRGTLTDERFFKAGVHDMDAKTAAALIHHGRAVGLAVELPIAEQPEPTLPADDAPKREVKASNAARKLAEKHNLILWSVNGTGKGGAITLADVKKLVK